jgi:hypothetical protein
MPAGQTRSIASQTSLRKLAFCFLGPRAFRFRAFVLIANPNGDTARQALCRASEALTWHGFASTDKRGSTRPPLGAARATAIPKVRSAAESCHAGKRQQADRPR